MALSCRAGLLPSVPTPVSSSRRAQSCRLICRAAPQDGRGSHSEPLGLPGGGVWLGRSTGQGAFLYGSQFSFLLRRDSVGGEGLIVRRQQPKPVRVQRQAAVPIHSPANQGAGLSLVGLDLSSCSVVIDTEFELLEEQQQPPAAIQPNTTCTGIVPVSLGVEAVEELAAPKHPRRTQRVSFSCNLCGTGNVKDTNPHAWAHGSVFMRCEGCGVVHKLKDNLNIFHELRGPVFPPRHMRNSFLVQEVLDKIKEKNARRRQQDGAGGGDLLGN